MTSRLVSWTPTTPCGESLGIGAPAAVMASGLPRTARDAWFAPTVFPVTLQALEDAEDEEQRKVGPATDGAPGLEPTAHIVKR